MAETKWKHSGVRVVHANELDVNTAQTPGMNRAAAITHARAGAEKLWAGTVVIHPKAKTGAHHHGPVESVIYVVSGRARMRWGDKLEFIAEAGPGDFIYVPPYVPHQEINASDTEPLSCVLCRSGQEPVVVNLDIPVVEKPEEVHWVDNIHPAPKSDGPSKPIISRPREVSHMPLLGRAAMLLSFDIAADAIAEHDDWHTHEHLPERLSIPGFIRGTRWVSLRGQPRYFVMYEVAHLTTLTSEAYLQRLNNPTPWTSKIMTHYRGMRRGFCSVTASFGLGVGHVGLLVRFKAASRGRSPSCARGSFGRFFPSSRRRPVSRSVHLLEGAPTPQMTNEQRIRGADAGVDCMPER